MDKSGHMPSPASTGQGNTLYHMTQQGDGTGMEGNTGNSYLLHYSKLREASLSIKIY